jgi:hypothetical protein
LRTDNSATRFLGGVTQSEVEQDAVAEDRPEQGPEAELLGFQTLVEQAERDQPEDHPQQDAEVAGDRAPDDVLLELV